MAIPPMEYKKTLAPRNTLQRSVQWMVGRKQKGEPFADAVALTAYQFRRDPEEVMYLIAELEEALG